MSVMEPKHLQCGLQHSREKTHLPLPGDSENQGLGGRSEGSGFPVTCILAQAEGLRLGSKKAVGEVESIFFPFLLALKRTQHKMEEDTRWTARTLGSDSSWPLCCDLEQFSLSAELSSHIYDTKSMWGPTWSPGHCVPVP